MKAGSLIFLVMEVDMTEKGKPAAVECIVCDVCLKEVPITEAVVPEATDYVAHFCGLECYEKWKKSPTEKTGQEADKPGS